MNQTSRRLFLKLSAFTAALAASAVSALARAADATPAPQSAAGNMDLGNFLVSLAVKDLAASKAFYEKFGFKMVGGDAAKRYLVMKNGTQKLGLFQGMFEKNMLTFNPGWDGSANKLDSFTDIRELQRRLKAQGVKLAPEANKATTGPAFFMATDPDGNPILVDQHV